MNDTGERTVVLSHLSKGGPKGEASVRRTYTHAAIGREIEAIGGHYVVESEDRLAFEGRDVLVARGYMVIDRSCCGTGGCGFALVPGYVVCWQGSLNEEGDVVTEVEPVREEREKEDLRRLMLRSERVQQVVFW